MRVFVVSFLFLFLFSAHSFAEADPWYTVENINKLEISVFFEKDSLKINRIYNFHIKLYAELIKKHSSVNLVITHKDQSYLSQARALKLFEKFVRDFKVPSTRISINKGLPPVYKTVNGEKVVLFLRKTLAKRAPPKIKRKPVKQEVKRQVKKKAKQEYIYIKGAPKEEGKLKLSGFFGPRQYDFSNTGEDVSGLLFGGHAVYHSFDALSFVADVDFVLPIVGAVSSVEQNYALGFESRFEKWSLNTKVYGRQNWAWDPSGSRFVSVYDLGLHQGLDFKLVKKSNYLLNLGAWVELSLSNNISELRTDNVLSFNTEINFVWNKPKLFLSLYRTSRKYEVFDADIFGLNFGCYF